MDWILKLNNIGGFKGEHQFILKEGCNRIYAPNATGKSSLIQALKLLIQRKSISSNFLNSNSLIGDVQLQNSSDIFQIRVVKTSKGTIIPRNTKYLSKNRLIDKLAFLTSDHVLISGADEHNEKIIKEWINQVTNLNYYEKAFSICSKIMTNYRLLREKDQNKFYNKRKQLKILINNENEKVSSLEKRLTDIRQNFKGLTEIQELQSAKNKLKIEIEAINDKIKRFNDLKALKDEKLNLKKQIIVKKQEVNLCGNELKAKKEKIPELGVKIEHLDKNRTNLNQDLKDLDERKREFQYQIDLYEKTLTSESEICIHCGNKILRNVIEQNITDLQNHLNLKIEEYHEIKKSIEEINDTIKELEDEQETYRHKLPDKERKLTNRLYVLDRKVYILEEKIKKMPKYDDAKLKEDRSQKLKQLNEIGKKIIKLTSNDENTQKEQESLVNKINVLQDSIKNKEGLMIKLDLQIDELNKFDILMERLKKILSRIQNKIYFIQEEFLDNINQNLKDILKNLDFKSIKSIFINDDLSITIARPGNLNGRYNELSNFERKLVSIIIGISAKNAMLPDFPLFIIDEPLDSADDLRFEKTLDYIKQKVSVLIVTKPVFDDKTEILSQENIIYT